MRFWTMVAGIPLSLGLLGCGDEPAGAIADETVLSWQVGCPNGGCTSFDKHDPDDEEQMNTGFRYSCGRASSGFHFTLEDPGDEMAERTRSKVTVTNVNADGSTCNVRIEEAEDLGASSMAIVGTCPAVCRLTNVRYDQDGYSFQGMLHCPEGLAPPRSNEGDFSLSAGVGTGDPINVRLDNCD